MSVHERPDPEETEPSQEPSAGPGLLRRLGGLVWRLVVGAALCQSLLGGIVVVGFAMEAVKRRVTRRSTELATSHECALGEPMPATSPLPLWPNFFWREGGLASIRLEASGRRGLSRLLFLVATPLHALGRNLKVGLLGVATTWVLTAPAGVLWALAWHAGWNNSFTKGYEQAQVYPLIGIAGILLFALVMLYVPLGQARQAATGSWRAFFDLPFLGRLMLRCPGRTALLAGLYTLASLPLNLLRTAPVFFNVINPATLEMSNGDLRQLLQTYFFWSGLVAVVLLLALRLTAGRIYADALADALGHGTLDARRLHAWERQHFAMLAAASSDPEPRHPLASVARAGLRPLRAVAIALALALWITAVAQVFVAEFFAYHGPRGWLNQPLIQVPWVRYIPPGLL